MPGQKRAASHQNPAQDEEAFPRGGGSGLAPIDAKKMKEEAYAEAEADLFGSAGKGGSKKRKSKGRSGEDDDDDAEDAFFNSMSMQGKVPKFAEVLKYKNIRVGSKLWGAIIEVTPNELVVSLPHGLRGHVAYTEASDILTEAAAAAGNTSTGKRRYSKAQNDLVPLTALFNLGQLVRCTVVGKSDEANNPQTEDNNNNTLGGPKTSKHKRIEVSLRLSKFSSGLGADSIKPGAQLPACVKSVEDHGYVLAFGIKGTSGFLPKKSYNLGKLTPGALLETVIVEAKAGGHAVVACDHESVSGAVTSESEGLNIGTLLPGALVTARIRNILSDGLLVSFLTFFNGTIDPFHLGSRATGDWKKQYSQNQRIKARILYVDSETKQVALTLLKHLVDSHAPHNFPMLGQMFDEARVARVDPGLGVMLSLPVPPGSPPLTPGYAHLSNLSDEKIDDIDKKFRLGQGVKCRVIGFRPMDGLAVLSLKPSVLNHSILSIEDLAPGMVVEGSVLKSSEEGLVVQLAPSLRVFVPALHMSDLASIKTHKKFKPGKKVTGRVLDVDHTGKKASITLKPSLVESKLPVIAMQDTAVPGVRSHGTVTGVQEYGVFVEFYNKVKGMAHITECGLPQGQKPTDAFTVGQVVKCRVLGADASRRTSLRLSLVTKKKGAEDAAEAAATASFSSIIPGTTVSGTISAIHSKDEVVQYYELECTADSENAAHAASAVVKGRLEVVHLADHPTAIKALSETLTVGAKLEGLLVLQRLEAVSQLRLTRKASLVAAAAAGELPKTLGEVSEGLIAPGYIASVTNDAVFVRFLDGLTGRAGLAQLADTFVADPHTLFFPGQTVRAQVVQVDTTKNRFSLTLKPSLCTSPDAGLLASLFADKDICQALSTEDADVDWDATFPIGTAVAGEVHGVKEYGTLCDMAGHADVVGLAAPHQSPDPAPKPGAGIKGLVLDVNKKDGIVDLSLLERLVERAVNTAAGSGGKSAQKKKRKSSAGAVPVVDVGMELSCTVELVKADEGYCVVSLPEGTSSSIAFLSTCDYNTLPGSNSPTAPTMIPGDVVTAKVVGTQGQRVLLQVAGATKPPTNDQGTGGKKENSSSTKNPAPAAGSVVSGTVSAVHASHVDVTLDSGHRGRVHITEATDVLIPNTTNSPEPKTKTKPSSKKSEQQHQEQQQALTLSESPLKAMAVGSVLKECVVLGKVQGGEGRKHGILELSTRPSLIKALKATPEAKINTLTPGALSWSSISKGQQLQGFVQEVSGEHVWIMFSPSIRGRVFIPQALSSWKDGSSVRKLFPPGTPVSATVLSVDSGKHALDLTLTGGPSFKPGSTAIGLVVGVAGNGIRVKLAPAVSGRVTLCDVHDAPVRNALKGLAQGQYVQVGIMSEHSVSGKGPGSRQLELSLKPSDGGKCATHAVAERHAYELDDEVAHLPPNTSASDLKPGQKVAGYVKSAGTSGVFLLLSRNLDARIRLRQLSADFVDDPNKAYPEGTRLVGSVLSIEAGRVDVTLRSTAPKLSLESLEEGQVVKGRIKRVEKFGVFVELEGSGITGLAHLSELADEFVRDIGGLFVVGDPVAARVLKIDQESNRLSLGLKPSYFQDMSDGEERMNGEESEESGDDFDAELEGAMAGQEEESDDEDGMDWEGGVDGEGGDVDLDEVLAAEEEEEEEEESESEYESA